MKITEKQLLIMFRVFEGTLAIQDMPDMDVFGYDAETRRKIYNQILNQQSDEIVDVKEDAAILND